MSFTVPCHKIFLQNYFSSAEYFPPETPSNAAICLHLNNSSTALWAWYFLAFLWHHPESVLIKEADFHVYW